jgi:crossover junction endodeoxyribonuclease RuvC
VLILGLDPGSLHTGYGLLDKQGSALTHVEAGRFSCPKDLALPQRLAYLVGRLEDLLARRPPDIAVLETPFHGMNARSLIVLAQARGALLAVLAMRGVEIREYSPAEIKSAVTGNGRADKEQVARMVRLLLAVRGEGWASDATDALATAICGAQRLRLDLLAERSRTSK